MIAWNKAQEWENEWHGNCVNSLNEELKQLVYARYMGLEFKGDAKTPYIINAQGKSILDIGAGPYSLLLKTNAETKWAIDPLMDKFPSWVSQRYEAANVITAPISGEEIKKESFNFDEVWIYNCLQHTKNPMKIIENAKAVTKLIRIFEWVDTGVNIGHLHSLSEDFLNQWLGGEGKVEQVNQFGAVGKAYFGIFLGDRK